MNQQQQFKTLSKSKNESLLDRREELNKIIADASEQLSSINDELMVRVLREESNKLIVGDHTVSLVKRLSFKDVPLEIAKKFRAVKKVVDPSVLKPLYEKGVKIPNVAISEYILVK